MIKYFYNFLIYCFIFNIISCGKTTEENVNDTVAKTNDNVFGGTGGGETGSFVMVGNLGDIFTSSDGTSWDNSNSGTTDNLSGITYGDSTFVTVGDNGVIITSSSGTTWT